MSRVNYVVCDICGENIESKHNFFHYRIAAKGYWRVVGGVLDRMHVIDLCGSCWDKIRKEVRAVEERDAS